MTAPFVSDCIPLVAGFAAGAAVSFGLCRSYWTRRLADALAAAKTLDKRRVAAIGELRRRRTIYRADA